MMKKLEMCNKLIHAEVSINIMAYTFVTLRHFNKQNSFNLGLESNKGYLELSFHQIECGKGKFE